MMTRNGEEAVDMVVRVDAPPVLTVTITVSPPPGRVVMLVMFGDARLSEFTNCCLPSPSAVTENSRLPLPPPACVTSAVSAPLNSMTTRSHAAPPQTALLVFPEVLLCVADLISVMVAVGAAAASGSSTGARVGIAAGAGDAGAVWGTTTVDVAVLVSAAAASLPESRDVSSQVIATAAIARTVTRTMTGMIHDRREGRGNALSLHLLYRRKCRGLLWVVEGIAVVGHGVRWLRPGNLRCGLSGRLPECSFGDLRCRYVTLTPTDDCAAEGRL